MPPQGQLAIVMLWQSPHRPLGSGLLRACYILKKEKGHIKGQLDCHLPRPLETPNLPFHCTVWHTWQVIWKFQLRLFVLITACKMSQNLQSQTHRGYKWCQIFCVMWFMDNRDTSRSLYSTVLLWNREECWVFCFCLFLFFVFCLLLFLFRTARSCIRFWQNLFYKFS